jgi:hypothetical protein
LEKKKNRHARKRKREKLSFTEKEKVFRRLTAARERKRERREKTRAVVGLEAVPFQPEMAAAMVGVGRRWGRQIKPSDPTWYASPSSS